MNETLVPVFLRLEGRHVLVVGGGPVAVRKIDELVQAKARVRVVAPAALKRVRDLARVGAVTWEIRPFEPSDVDGAWVVYAATGDPEVQASVEEAATSRRIFLVALDDPERATAFSGAVVRRPPCTIAISSTGAAPALSRLVRELVEQILPGEEWVEAARALRSKWRADGTPMDQRFGELVRAFAARAEGPSDRKAAAAAFFRPRGK